MDDSRFSWRGCMTNNRFTHHSKIGRNKISWNVRNEVFRRDDYTCQYCGKTFPRESLSIDHLIPLSQGGIDEIINYVTSCRVCNERKGELTLSEFAKLINIQIEELPVHGDPIIDNTELPIQFRLLRKRVIDSVRTKGTALKGRRAQYNLERQFRHSFWETPESIEIRNSFSRLPGQVKVMIPEIRSIAHTEEEFLLLIELAKSANTRNLIGTILKSGTNIEKTVRDLGNKTRDSSLKLRIGQAVQRYETKLHKLKNNDDRFQFAHK